MDPVRIALVLWFSTHAGWSAVVAWVAAARFEPPAAFPQTAVAVLAVALFVFGVYALARRRASAAPVLAAAVAVDTIHWAVWERTSAAWRAFVDGQLIPEPVILALNILLCGVVFWRVARDGKADVTP